MYLAFSGKSPVFIDLFYILLNVSDLYIHVYNIYIHVHINQNIN